MISLFFAQVNLEGLDREAELRSMLSIRVSQLVYLLFI